MIAGGGAAGAADELRALAERLGAPVITTANGKGTIPDDHPLALGARLNYPPRGHGSSRATSCSRSAPSWASPTSGGRRCELSGRLVRVDIDPAQAHSNNARGGRA